MRTNVSKININVSPKHSESKIFHCNYYFYVYRYKNFARRPIYHTIIILRFGHGYPQ